VWWYQTYDSRDAQCDGEASRERLASEPLGDVRALHHGQILDAQAERTTESFKLGYHSVWGS